MSGAPDLTPSSAAPSAASKRARIGEMRQNLGLREGDTRRDAHIESMTALERLELLCGWHIGDRAWAQSFLDWAKAAGFSITDGAKLPRKRSGT